ncbi:hypothetical protein E4U57_000868 [Claviceps arundinis]|uniref:Uncharacterized protein n=1 Tax=Claviceps arundinis TaxID=1623583 RepID=A0A9P7SM48_9HYPO|nr:hypothetical protein E4U56_005403 [Claviceps arundinis]KAG5959181.1 hypothetical protein E4U57_000868 [Claviceps arundinis]
MSTEPSCEGVGTTKISDVHRGLVYRSLQRRHARLQALLGRAWQYATPRSAWSDSTAVSERPEDADPEDAAASSFVSPAAEIEDIAEMAYFLSALEADELDLGDAATRSYFFLPSQFRDNLNEIGEVERHEDVGADDGGEESDVAMPLPGSGLGSCPERDAMIRVIDRLLSTLDEESGVGNLLSWENSFAGLLEALLAHLDKQCCNRGAAPAQIARPELSGRQADYSDRRDQACVKPAYIDHLQKEIDVARLYMSLPAMKSCSRLE